MRMEDVGLGMGFDRKAAKKGHGVETREPLLRFRLGFLLKSAEWAFRWTRGASSNNNRRKSEEGADAVRGRENLMYVYVGCLGCSLVLCRCA